jgi:hypothetical protein
MYRLNGIRLDGTYKDNDLLKILLWIGFCVAVIYFSFQVGQWRVKTHYSTDRSKLGRQSTRSINFSLPRWIQVDFEESQLPLAELDYLSKPYPTI